MLNIVTINANLCTCPPIRFNGAPARSERFADALYSNTLTDLDVICMQELIINRKQVLKSFYKHKYQTRIATGSFLNANIRFVQSGLCIISKWPILHQAHHVFTGKTYHAEMLMNKAVLYAKIHYQEKYHINVFVTHTQAWATDVCKKIRIEQMKQIYQFIQALNINSQEVLIVCGDFNIDFYEHSRILQEMMNIINCKMNLPSSPQFSFDPTINQLVGTDDANEYKTRSQQNGCYEQFLETGICVCCPKQLIDGIAISLNHLQPLSSSTNVIINTAFEPFNIYINVSTQRLITNVSDHFAVLTEFKFNFIETEYKVTPYKQDYIVWEWVCLQIVLTMLLFIGLLSFFKYIRQKIQILFHK